MKKIIEGKKYDTETATEIGYYWNGLGCGDFRNFSETLYKTPHGRYFLAGEGGPMTKYSETNGNTSWGTEKIFVLTKEEAVEWLERYDFTEEIEEHFGNDVEEA